MKDEIQKLREQGKSYNEIVAILGCSKSQVAYYANDKYRQKHNARSIERRKRMKLEAIAYKGDRCQICGYDKCIEALEFHHIDPSTKDDSLAFGGSFVRGTTSLERIKPELDKCILLCCRCHREVHANITKL